MNRYNSNDTLFTDSDDDECSITDDAVYVITSGMDVAVVRGDKYAIAVALQIANGSTACMVSLDLEAARELRDYIDLTIDSLEDGDNDD